MGGRAAGCAREHNLARVAARDSGADGAVREEKRKVDMDSAFFQFIDDLAKKYGGDEVADEAWIEKMASLIESAPPEKFVDSDTLQAWLEDELQKGAGGALNLANSVERVPAGNGNGGQFTGETNQPDGKSDTTRDRKRKIRPFKSSLKADEQARKCGYKNVSDMMAQASDVPDERVAEIQEGFPCRCKPHEAVAVILENKPFDDVENNSVQFGDDILEHYIEGRRRRDNEPKLDNLADLPFAIKAVKTDIYGITRYKYPRGTTPDPLYPPRGTQREYHLKTERGQMKVFVYIHGGKINGWHVEQ